MSSTSLQSWLPQTYVLQQYIFRFHGSETWPITKELERKLERTEMRKVRWVCVKCLQDKVPPAELRDRLGIESISTVLQRNRLRCFGHVQKKLDDVWTKKCIQSPKWSGPNCKGRPKVTWMEVINRDWKELRICKEEAGDRAKRKNLISTAPVDRDMFDG